MGIQTSMSARILFPGLTLDSRCEVICPCGFKRDCGVMETTADRTAELHAERLLYPACAACVVVKSPVKAPPRLDRVRKIRSARGLGGRGSGTLHM